MRSVKTTSRVFLTRNSLMPGRRLTPTCRRCAARKSWPELTARQEGIKSVCDCVYGKQRASGTVPLPVGKPSGHENEGQENIFRSHHSVENSLNAAFIPHR